MRLARVNCSRTNSAHKIFPERNGFKMMWIHAPSVPALMVKYKILWNWPTMYLIRKAMRWHVSVVVEVAIALGFQRSGPYPTTRVGFWADLIVEPLFCGVFTLVSSHARNICTIIHMDK